MKKKTADIVNKLLTINKQLTLKTSIQDYKQVYNTINKQLQM